MNARPHRFRRFLFLLALTIFGLVVGCQVLEQILKNQDGQQSPAGDGPLDTMTDGDWSSLKTQAMAKVKFAPGWTAPQLVPGAVNSIGWEDSASISPDGNTIYFSYIPCDLFNLSKDGMPLGKFSRYRRGPDRGNTPAFALDTLYAQKQGSAFGPPQQHALSLNTDPVHTSEAGLMEAGNFFYYNTNHPNSQTEGTLNIWRAEKGKPAVKLAYSREPEDSDPHFINGELFFWSEKRSSGMGGSHKHLWMMRQTGDNTWTAPVCLAAPVNEPGSDSWQCHLTADGSLYFTSGRGGDLAIYSSKRLGENAWAPPVKVAGVEAGGAALGLAEPSLTADGKQLYFCVLFKNPGGSYDLDIAFSQRTP